MEKDKRLHRYYELNILIIMKKKILTLLLAVAASIGTMFASNTQVDGIWYNFNSTNNTAEVTYQGSSYFEYSNEYAGVVTIPASVTYSGTTYSVTSIGGWAFRDCSGLTSVTIPSSVTSIGNYAFDNCSGLTSVTIGNSVTSIGVEAFSGCSGLTSVTIPNSVTSIGKWAFNNCTGLTSVTIPNSVTSIGNYTFLGCSSLTSITIPNGVTSIGYRAFDGCSGLTSITIEAETPPALDPLVFNNTNDCPIYVPCGTIDAYTSAWPEYANRIIIMPLNYQITGNVNIEGAGSVQLPQYICDDTVIIAVSNYGYHFTKWSDGNTDNPRTIVLTQDTTFTAEFAKNTYTISTTSANPEWGTTAGDTAALYLDEVEISAIPNYGYHFVRWNDNNTYNPRMVSVTEDKTYTATFAKNVYSITANAEHGSISGNRTAEYLDEVTLSVSSDYGYHFAQWSDGNIDNPRSIILVSDTTFTAEFAKNTYTISTTSANPEWGTTAGDTAALYLDEVEISAIPNYGYHFVRWNDNNTYNPRMVSVTEDKTYTATFAKNVYSITANAEHGSISGNRTAEYLDEVTLSVSSDYGYHFAQWSDGNIDNPRSIILVSDTTFTAEFAKNTYTISTTSANPEWGTTAGDTAALYLDEVEISAIPNYGYHFDHWEIEKYREYSEYISVKPYVVKFSVPETWSNPYAWIWETGNQGHWEMLSYENGMYVYRTEDDNRNIILVPNGASWTNGQTNDLAITESCCYTITGGSGDSNNYYTSNTYIANKTYDCLTPFEVQIIPRIDTVVSHSFENPLAFIVTVNQKVIAHFAKNEYSITANAEHGSISGNSSAEYLDFVTLTVTPDSGYHFTQWSDGLKDNPRIFQITSDTTFTAEFAPDRVGTCGKDLALVWSYDPTNKVLTIGNAGSFTENMQFGLEAPNEMEELVIGNSVTAIGANAFAGISSLKKVTIGESVKTIGEQAFYNCVNLETIFNYRPTPTNAYSNAFDGVDKFECELYVLTGSINMYKAAAVWRDFYYTYAIGAEETTVTTNDVQVEPQDNAVTLTWPTSNNAATYTIEITKDSIVFCTLIFNANGQLTGIAYALDREGTYHAPAAIMTANGLQFTVTGLSSNTLYGYSLTTKDAANQALATYSGDFTTTGGGVTTEIDNTSFLLYDGTEGTRKIIRNGRILILRGEKVYTLQGQEVK